MRSTRGAPGPSRAVTPRSGRSPRVGTRRFATPRFATRRFATLRVGTLLLVTLVAALVAASCSSDGGDDTTASPTRATTAAGGAVTSATGSLPPNPFLGPAGTATMHADSGSSDATARAGPGAGPVATTTVELGAVCPAILIGSDRMPVALCTSISELHPVVHLLDPDTGQSLASLDLAAGGLFGGVYGYLDEDDRLVMVEGGDDLVRIGHHERGGAWRLSVDERTSLAGAVAAGDTVTSLAADYGGEVWFATERGTVGLVDTGTGGIETASLDRGEQVENSISTSPAGVAVASDHAAYLFARGAGGEVERMWRVAYDRGPSRKPGQLSWGTGSTPTFFGPTDGADYVALVDNASPEVHLVVVATSGAEAGEEVCAPVVLADGGPGSENSPIGSGRAVVVTSTYGYEYPRLPEGAGPSQPVSAPFEGGMTRVEVVDDGTCSVAWNAPVRSVAVPRLSTTDSTITTLTQPAAGGHYAYAVVDAATGAVLTEQDLGAGVGDPLQLAGTIGPDRVLWQGTVGAVERIAPAAPVPP